ncbi:MAG: AMP-binding acetyl-CoA synthetase [Betaproteobacteria bacterium]|nr:AMP-binding acetyl-CoA synthetase [Betaproteobacteria bacterium]NBY05430.1 AMP-binding acetyl-CoA synthetase [Betaproteobacteria bacterium]
MPKFTLLDHVYRHEKAQGSHTFLTQPTGGGAVVSYTWAQTMDQARRMATHLQSLGLEPGTKVGILSKNCAHFFMAELAIWMAGYTTVAIFPTENAQTVRYVMEHSESRVLFVGKLDTWPEQASGVPEGVPCIAMPLSPPTPFRRWDDIVANTLPMPGEPTRSPQDLAMIMYTSGSTGQPKGVMHNFGRICDVAQGIFEFLENDQGPGKQHRMLSYLPLAHVFERAFVESVALYSGHIQVFFAEALDTFVTDLQRARPTIFISVPRLWLKFQQGVFAKLPNQKLNFLLRIPFLGRLIRRKVLAGLGLDQTTLAGSGSAPLPAELVYWYRNLGLRLVEGYAMTEDFAYSHTGTDQFNEPGYVGIAYPGVEVRLSPEGEILIKSPGQMVGYYKRPDLDAESFTADGYFRTGDLGERRSDGQLKITGRVKELFKTSKGKYVAPAPIENRLNAHPMIELSMVSGSAQSQPYALVVLAEQLRAEMHNPEMRDQVNAELGVLLKEVNRQLAPHEQLHCLVIASSPWGIENGCLTPTMKIKRSHIEDLVRAQVDGWYAKNQAVIWA